MRRTRASRLQSARALAALVGQVRVVMPAGVAVRIGVDGGAGQPRYGMGELVFGIGGDLVCGDEREVGVHNEFGFGVQPVTDPAESHPGHVLDAVDASQRGFGLVDDGGVDSVHEASVDLAGGVPASIRPTFLTTPSRIRETR